MIAFGAALASGQTLIGALQAMGPGLDTLSQMMRTFGLTATDTFAELLLFKQFVNDNKELAASIDGINQMMRGLNESGMLTQETFADLTATAVDTFNRIVEQGLSGDQALRLMQPTLQTIWQMQKDFGYEVDEATQALLDEAVAAGIVGEKHRSATERMVAGIERVADILAAAFGDRIPRALQETINQVGRIRTGLDEIPENVGVTVTITTEEEGEGGGGGGESASRTARAVMSAVQSRGVAASMQVAQASVSMAAFEPVVVSGGAGQSEAAVSLMLAEMRREAAMNRSMLLDLLPRAMKAAVQQKV